MDIELHQGTHKSIKEFKWIDVPRFAVITGPNGSGKSGLLETIARGAGAPTQENHRGVMTMSPQPLDVRLSEPVAPGAAIFLRSSWQVGDGQQNVSAVIDLANSIWQGRAGTEPNDHEGVWAVIEESGEKRQTLTRDRFDQLLPPNFAMLIKRRVDVSIICTLFLSYKYLLDNGANEKELGPLPWDVVNEGLEAAGLQYTVSPPVTTPAMRWTPAQTNYKFELTDKITGDVVPCSALSSGEIVMLQVALWQFAFSHTGAGVQERLLLLDEPDAHLHPALTSAFLRVIKSELVDKYGVRVIMSTHSPSTVALVDEEDLFVMRKGATSLARPASKWEALSQLTAGFLTIGTESKTVFVEDEDDRVFYNEVQQALLNPVGSSPLLDRSKAINFVPASKGDKTGGCHKVMEWVSAIESTQVAGLIDKDAINVERPRLYVLERYAMENYLLDPIFVFGYLMDGGEAPEVDGVEFTAEERRDVLLLDNSRLQRVADTMMKIYRDLMEVSWDGSLITTTYIGNKTVAMDRWFMDIKVKALFGKLKTQRKWGISDDALRARYRSKQVIPQELFLILQRIQQQ